jgi:regulator of nucleoside diphosphate kinase
MRRFPSAIEFTNHQISIMKKPKIIITDRDHEILSKMLAHRAHVPRKRSEVQPLEEELHRAEIVPPYKVPPDVITMNSRAELLDLDTGERMEFTVVLPEEANLSEGKISILAPVGTGMLGYRMGDAFEWPAPNGLRRLKVIHVSFQPEAAMRPTQDVELLAG